MVSTSSTNDPPDLPVDPDPNATKVGENLDMANGHDRRMVNRSIAAHKSKHKRWPGIDDETKAQTVRAVKAAMAIALQKKDGRSVESCARTLGLFERMNQDDEHMEMRMGQRDEHHRDRMVDGERVRVVNENPLESMPPELVAPMTKLLSDYSAKAGLAGTGVNGRAPAATGGGAPTP